MAVAAPAEVRAVLRGLGDPGTEIPGAWESRPIGDRFEVLVTGVGKANACGAVSRQLARSSYGAVVSAGIAGVLPSAPASIVLGTVVAADVVCMADEGVETPEGFVSIASLGFDPLPGGESLPVASGVLGWLRGVTECVGTIATVSVCSGTDAAAGRVAGRTGAVAEAMEGAGVALAAVRAGVAFGEIRAISNTTGDRSGQRWDLPRALSSLEHAVRTMAASVPSLFSDVGDGSAGGAGAS